MRIVSISSKGQFTIPKEFRDKISVKYYVFEVEGVNIKLKPVQIKHVKSIKRSKNDLKNFGNLAETSFSFWEDEKDNIYEDYYK